MKIAKKELEIEEKHLEYTKDVIRKLISEKNINIDEYKRDIVLRKKFLWQNLNDYKESEMYETMNDTDLDVNILNKDIVKVYKLERSLETPYFSRIDFESDGDVETFYIGLTGVDKDYDAVVYDWRAPISNLYYNYGLGNSKYEIEGHTFEGKTLLKRQFDIKMGKLIDVYDSLSGVTDDILEKVLEENTSNQMRNIVNTIQKEQNDIIRYNGKHNLVVEGIAGSGKTSVALHRVAYLLYNEKEYDNKNMLIFSPSDVFTEYISNVLPELGEENILSTTFQSFAKNYIKKMPVESLTEFIKRYYEKGVSQKEKSMIEEKLSRKYKDKIDKFIEEYYDRCVFKKKIGLKNKFITAQELNELKNSIPRNISFSDRIIRLAEKICGSFKIDEVKNSEKLTSILYKVLEIETDSVKLYEAFTHETYEEVLYEDIFGILYLYFEIVGYPSMSHIRVVVIDEAQDYSMWQFEFLKKVFNRAVFTILGDHNQAINPFLKYDTLESITTLFKDAKYKRLDNTYRSSYEIVKFSNDILGINVNPIRPSNGIDVVSKVEQNLKEDLKNDIKKFKDLGFKNIAIITKTEIETNKIKNMIDIENVSIIPVYQSKGLEYDAVIVYTDLENKYKDDEKNLYYVACTRALHALVVYNQK